MAEQKGLGSKLLGIFVEPQADLDEQPSAEKSPAQIVAELASQSKAGAQGPGLRLDKVAPPQPGAAIDFDALFREAGMDAGELDRVKKAEELLKGLPEGTPQPVKKQIVEASLKAFGFEIEKIVLAAQNQRRALDAYVKVNETATAKALADAEAQIRAYNEKIAALRAEVERRNVQLGTIGAAALARKAQIQKVLEFFAATVTP